MVGVTLQGEKLFQHAGARDVRFFSGSLDKGLLVTALPWGSGSEV